MNFALQNNSIWQVQIAASFRNSYVSLLVRTHFLVVGRSLGLKFANYNTIIQEIGLVPVLGYYTTI